MSGTPFFSPISLEHRTVYPKIILQFTRCFLMTHWLRMCQQTSSLAHCWEERAKSWNGKSQLPPWTTRPTGAVPELRGGWRGHGSRAQSGKLKSWGGRRDVPRHQSLKIPTVRLLEQPLALLASAQPETQFPKWFLDVVCELTQIKAWGRQVICLQWSRLGG